jgi:hypothetical protein
VVSTFVEPVCRCHNMWLPYCGHMLLKQGQSCNIWNAWSRILPTIKLAFTWPFFLHLLAKNYKGEYGGFSNYKHEKSISTIRKTQRKKSVLDTNIRFIPSFCFMTLSMTLSWSHTPAGYFLKVLQIQVALTVYTWNHSLCPFSQKVVKVCWKYYPWKNIASMKNV